MCLWASHHPRYPGPDANRQLESVVKLQSVDGPLPTQSFKLYQGKGPLQPGTAESCTAEGFCELWWTALISVLELTLVKSGLMLLKSERESKAVEGL